MKPEQHFDKPGKSPFMDMQLVAKYADGGGAEPGVAVDPGVEANLGMRTAVAREGVLGSDLTATGVIDFNEREVAIVQPRANGFVQRVYARAPGDLIGKGAPIADLLIPEWGGAQTEFLAVLHTGDQTLISAGRRRLQLLGMSPELVSRVERAGRPAPTVTISSPMGGVIQKLDVRPGMSITAGQTLAEVNGIATVWLNVAVPEAQIAAVRVGQPVNVELAAYPGEAFSGRVAAVLPAAQVESHTLTARVELANRGGRLRPGLYAAVHFTAGGKPALLIPSEAVIRTGRRDLVMLALEGGRYQGAEIRIGREASGETEVLAGLAEGERVVVSGQFLLDSEASLSGLTVRELAKAGAGR